MINNLELVIFDMDGLMFDTERYYADAAQKIFDEHNIQVNMQALYDVIGTTLPIDLKKLNQSSHSDEEVADLMNKSYVEAIERLYIQGPPVKKGLYDLLEKLKSINVHMCVATSSSIERTTKYLKKAEVFDYFDFIITGADVEHGKPEPDIFLQACVKASIVPDKALVLEDSNNGGLAAKSAGIRYIIIPDINQPYREIADNAYAVLNDLNQVADLI